MASPQKENGGTIIANELYDIILKTDFTRRELKMVLAVIRFSYGFNRKEAKLSLRFLSKATNIKYRHTQSTVSNLISKNVLQISTEAKGIQPREIKFNKNYESWFLSIDQKGITKDELETTKKVSVAMTEEVSVDTTKKVSKKYNINKTLNKEERTNLFAAKVYSNNGHSKEDLEAFIEYWTESGENQKKLRFETEKVFDISRRLRTWMRNKEKWAGTKQIEAHLDDF
jgi:phage replication O-like protein O